MSIAKLCLGTVQLGLNYGINNKTGKPSQAEARSILNTAIDAGISFIDTAAAYGNAENIVGEFLQASGLQNRVGVISKLSPNLFAQVGRQAVSTVLEELRKSLDRLQLNSLEGFLLHTPGDFYNIDVIKALHIAREEGLIKHIGVSIYESEDALNAVKSGLIDSIQIPYNIFDQRLDKSDFFNIAKDNAVTIFARSPFLQGLLFMKPEAVPAHLPRAEQYLLTFERICLEYEISKADAALNFSLHHPGIDYVVFGVETLAQLQEDLEAAEKNGVSKDCSNELRKAFVNIEKEIIFPSLWATE